MSVFETSPQYKSGADVADFLDHYLRCRGWAVRPTTRYEERTLCLGDRRITRGSRGCWVEYKSGIQTHYTGNVFLETVSVDTAGKEGWLYTCRADWLLYACLLDNQILLFRPEHLRSITAELVARSPVRATGKGQNRGYKTHGVVLPLADARAYAHRVLPI